MKKIKLWRKKPTKKELMKKHRNDYMLLSRLKQDCDYFLGHGNRYEGRLWAGSVKDQIKKMKKLYKKFPRKLKPKWLTLKDIRDYEKKMTKKTPYISKRKILNKKVLKRRKREEGWLKHSEIRIVKTTKDKNKTPDLTDRIIKFFMGEEI
jgi:hypothetical protein